MKKLLPFILELIAALLRNKKKTLPALLLFAASCNQQKQQEAYRAAAPVPTSTWKKIPKDIDGGWYYNASKPFPAKPGDTVLLEASYDFISLNDVNGTAAKPIVFISQGGTKVGYRIKDGRGASMLTQRCSYLVFDGINAGNDLDSTYNAQGWNLQASHNIEIRNFKLHHSEVGFFANQLTGRWPNLYIHDGEVSNINNRAKTAFGEGFYLGQTSGKDTATTSLPNVRIENINMFAIGGDGIQLANCVNAQVRNVTIDGFGLNRVDHQWFGLLVGGGTSGLFENITMTNGGGGTPFEILGMGNVTVRNCTASNWEKGISSQDAIYIRQSFPTLRVGLYGLRIDKKGRNWVYVATPGVVVDSSGNIFGVPVPPVIVPPVDPCKELQSKYDALQNEYKALQTEHEAFIRWKQLTLEIFK